MSNFFYNGILELKNPTFVQNSEMEDTAKSVSSFSFDITKFSQWTKDLIEQPLVASEFAVPYLQWWMPISAFGYFGVF